MRDIGDYEEATYLEELSTNAPNWLVRLVAR
jgi:hypothetical protein